jgi:hypothetical protein
MRQRRLARTPHGFGLLPFRSPLLRESSLFLEVLRCFSSPGAPCATRSDGPSRPPGCPIRRSRDYRVPAPPPRISLRGRVLPRLQAPRHPPSAHTCRASLAPLNAPPSPTRALPCHQVRSPAPGHVTHVHLVLLRFSAWTCVCVCATHDASVLRSHRSGMPARIGGSGPLKVRAPG